MKILMITENDPAGMGIAFCNAINRYTEHQCRLITTEIRYNFMFKKDLHVPFLDGDGFDEIRDLLKKADVLHFHMLSDEHMKLGDLKVIDYVKGKKILHHHHGHPGFRSDPLKYQAKYKKLERKSIVSTPDLLKLLPDAEWIPNIVPINDALFMPLKRAADAKVRVCQAPTRKDLKNTEAFEEVMDSLTQQYDNLEYYIIENTLYSECLKLKQGCDIQFDHMQGYFGVSSLESLSQGKPVIAGLDACNVESIKQFTGVDDIPWLIVRNKKQLEDVFSELIEDEDLREDKGAKSRQFMEFCWTEHQVLDRLINIYNSL